MMLYDAVLYVVPDRWRCTNQIPQPKKNHITFSTIIEMLGGLWLVEEATYIHIHTFDFHLAKGVCEHAHIQHISIYM